MQRRSRHGEKLKKRNVFTTLPLECTTSVGRVPHSTKNNWHWLLFFFPQNLGNPTPNGKPITLKRLWLGLAFSPTNSSLVGIVKGVRGERRSVGVFSQKKLFGKLESRSPCSHNHSSIASSLTSNPLPLFPPSPLPHLWEWRKESRGNIYSLLDGRHSFVHSGWIKRGICT